MKRIVLSCLATLALMALLSTQGLAQCPTGFLPGVTTYWVPALNCTVTVNYCYADPTGPIWPKQQMMVVSFTVAPPCAGVPLQPYQITAIYEGLIKNVPHVNCSIDEDPTDIDVQECGEWCEQFPNCFCPNAIADWQISAGRCLKPVPAPGNTVRYEPCSSVESDPCISVYEVCCIDGIVQATFLSMQTGGGTCSTEEQAQGCFYACPTMVGQKGCCDALGIPQNPCP